MKKKSYLFILVLLIILTGTFAFCFVQLQRNSKVDLIVSTNKNELHEGQYLDVQYTLKNNTFFTYTFFGEMMNTVDSNWYNKHNVKHKGIVINGEYFYTDTLFVLKPGGQKRFNTKWLLNKDPELGGYNLKLVSVSEFSKFVGGVDYVPLEKVNFIDFYGSYSVFPEFIMYVNVEGQTSHKAKISNIYDKPIRSNIAWVKIIKGK